MLSVDAATRADAEPLPLMSFASAMIFTLYAIATLRCFAFFFCYARHA